MFTVLGIFCTFAGLAVLCIMLADIVIDAVPRLSKNFFINFPSRKPEEAGILSAWVGTIWLMVVTACFALPVGIAAAIYLEEYARKNRLTNFIELNIANLAGVPSIIYGLLGLGLFVRFMHLGRSVLTGGLTLALLVLPVIILSTREALRAVPFSIREGSFALGATKWQTVRHQVLPAAFGNILTGIILAMSRAIGETAPLITIGALTYIAFLPQNPDFIPRFGRYRIFPAGPARPVYSPAYTDIQLDFQTTEGISRKCGGRNSGAAVFDISNERTGNNTKTSLSKENMVRYETADYKSQRPRSVLRK